MELFIAESAVAVVSDHTDEVEDEVFEDTLICAAEECVVEEEIGEDCTSLTVEFSVGELFDSYEKLEAKVKHYSKCKFMEFWKRDARTIAAASKRLGRQMKPDLKYYELKLCCIHGGQKFRARGKGVRNTS